MEKHAPRMCVIPLLILVLSLMTIQPRAGQIPVQMFAPGFKLMKTILQPVPIPAAEEAAILVVVLHQHIQKHVAPVWSATPLKVIVVLLPATEEMVVLGGGIQACLVQKQRAATLPTMIAMEKLIMTALLAGV